MLWWIVVLTTVSCAVLARAGRDPAVDVLGDVRVDDGDGEVAQQPAATLPGAVADDARATHHEMAVGERAAAGAVGLVVRQHRVLDGEVAEREHPAAVPIGVSAGDGQVPDREPCGGVLHDGVALARLRDGEAVTVERDRVGVRDRPEQRAAVARRAVGEGDVGAEVDQGVVRERGAELGLGGDGRGARGRGGHDRGRARQGEHREEREGAPTHGDRLLVRGCGTLPRRIVGAPSPPGVR